MFSHKNQVGSKSAKQKTNKGSSTRKTKHLSGKGQLAKTKHVDSPHPLKTTTHSITNPDTCDSQSVSTSVQLLNMGECQQVDNGILCQVRVLRIVSVFCVVFAWIWDFAWICSISREKNDVVLFLTHSWSR